MLAIEYCVNYNGREQSNLILASQFKDCKSKFQAMFNQFHNKWQSLIITHDAVVIFQ